MTGSSPAAKHAANDAISRSAHRSSAILFALYRVFFVLGLLSFGGGVSAWMHREVVQVRAG